MSPEPGRDGHDALRLAIDGTRIDVASDDAADLAWLAEFLAPAFDVDAPGPERADHQLRLIVSEAEADRLCAALDRAPACDIEGLGFDGRFSRHRCFTDEHGRTWAHDERRQIVFGVHGGARSLVVVARTRDDHERVALMRVVRELATAALLDRGRLPVHGAAFGMNGRAVLICGPKRAGKTSLLVHALRCGGTFLSNDRLFVDTDGPPRAQAMPTVVTLRDGTLARHPGLAAALTERRFDRGRTIDECATGMTPPDERAPPDGRRRSITPAQFCRLAGAEMSDQAPIGLLLFPRIDPSVDAIEIEPLDAGAALRMMTRSLMKPSHPARHSPLFAPHLADTPIEPAAELQRCRRLVDAVPARTCRLGPDAYRDNLLDMLRRDSALAEAGA